MRGEPQEPGAYLHRRIPGDTLDSEISLTTYKMDCSNFVLMYSFSL